MTPDGQNIKSVRLTLAERKMLNKFVTEKMAICTIDVGWSDKGSASYRRSKKRFDELADLSRRLKS